MRFEVFASRSEKMAQPDTVLRTPARADDHRPAVDITSHEAPDPSRTGPNAEADASTTGAWQHQESGKQMDPEERRKLVEYQAYLLYLERGDRHGSEVEDWLAAERQIDGRRE
jgi:hypothetical protein